MVERARRHAVGGCLACVAGFSLMLVLAYWVGPAERLDRSVLDALSTPTDTLVNEVAYVGFLVVNFRPAWVLVGAITVLIALAFPSGHAAGSLAMSLAFLSVVPSSWRRPTAAAGIVFTLYISLGVLLLNYHYPGDVPAGWLLAAGWWFFLLAALPSSEPSSSGRSAGGR
jgi:membrane-associated phospholipid phosphatase